MSKKNKRKSKNILTLSTVVSRAKKVHGNKYEYIELFWKEGSKGAWVRYVCPDHPGVFQEQLVGNHLKPQGCPMCFHNNKKRLTLDSITDKCNKIHNSKYKYLKLYWITVNGYDRAMLLIECPVHGEFKQRLDAHMNGSGCYNCYLEVNKKTITFESAVKESRKVHGDRYKYIELYWDDSSGYNRAMLVIECPIHGIFRQRLDGHLSGNVCYQCSVDNSKLSKSDFITRSLKTQPLNMNDYTNTIITSVSDKATIKCNIHNKYYTQTVNDHMRGNIGCKLCTATVGELAVAKYLDKHNIDFIQEYRFTDVVFIHYYDFYLPELNILIEYDGEQHYKPVKNLGGKKGLIQTKIRDKRKDDLAITINIPLIRIPYYKLDELDKFLTHQIARHYKYIYKGAYITDFLSLCRIANLPGSTKLSDVKQYLTNKHR